MEEKKEKPIKQDVPINIDKKPYKSPDPTTGSALYTLGAVNAELYDLYRETRGQGEDELIPNNAQSVDLKPGDHFFSVKKKLNPGSKLWLLYPSPTKSI